ncbi:AraC family transcriptional regulator [Sphingobacterium sp. PCS056]|uniref:AraC family transcriptional regulator n=1 Tax=Sphingobacterium sp. PCS056 TaxID=2931400 RepID=UPI00200C499F|nr:AraC family transcriptional regulator [Sphingobacterium sp. PCS056]UPZ34750.1 AraC family transcriptional regulator [Sphingobacterium sp. PCS056]
MIKKISISEGFKGEEAISLPLDILQMHSLHPAKTSLFITHIGYYPEAKHHLRNREKGCNEHIIIYCSHGIGWIKHEDRTVYLSADHFYLIPAGEPHSYGSKDTNPWSIYWIHFKGNDSGFVQSLKGKPLSLKNMGSQSKKHSLDLFHNIYENLKFGYHAETLEYISFTLLYFLASLKYQEQYHRNNRLDSENIINKSILIMKENLEKKLTLQELSTFVGYSSSHLTRLFTEKMNSSPMVYYNRIRLEQACQYLKYSSYKIKEIAFKLGYFDPYHFSRSFNKEMGITPKIYRLQYNKTIE